MGGAFDVIRRGNIGLAEIQLEDAIHSHREFGQLADAGIRDGQRRGSDSGRHAKLLFYSGLVYFKVVRYSASRTAAAAARRFRIAARISMATTEPAPATNMSSCESQMSPCIPTNSSPRSGVRMEAAPASAIS